MKDNPLDYLFPFKKQSYSISYRKKERENRNSMVQLRRASWCQYSEGTSRSVEGDSLPKYSGLPARQGDTNHTECGGALLGTLQRLGLPYATTSQVTMSHKTPCNGCKSNVTDVLDNLGQKINTRSDHLLLRFISECQPEGPLSSKRYIGIVPTSLHRSTTENIKHVSKDIWRIITRYPDRCVRREESSFHNSCSPKWSKQIVDNKMESKKGISLSEPENGDKFNSAKLKVGPWRCSQKCFQCLHIVTSEKEENDGNVLRGKLKSFEKLWFMADEGKMKKKVGLKVLLPVSESLHNDSALETSDNDVKKDDENEIQLRRTPTTPKTPIDFDEAFKHKEREIEAATESDNVSWKDVAQELRLPKRKLSYDEWLCSIGKFSESKSLPRILESDNTKKHPSSLSFDFCGELEALTDEERKENLQKAIDWIKSELKEIQKQDVQLARILLRLRLDMQRYRLQASCSVHQALVEEVVLETEEEEEILRSSFDFLGPTEVRCRATNYSRLRDMGVTRMNLASRRFSLR